MTLKTIPISSNKKLGSCAATYRSGELGVYSTCPSSCPLMPASANGADTVDEAYFLALKSAVPSGGQSWTYTHFKPAQLPNTVGHTVVNISTDSLDSAVAMRLSGHPTVVTLPVEQGVRKHATVRDVRFIQCPAEYNSKVTCHNCGGEVALCARPDRDFVVAFTAHGTSKKLVGTGTGGCYGSSGPVAIHWARLSKEPTAANDAEVLTKFVRSLPYGTRLRHHVVGDIGVPSLN